jgi:hypothetical protein
MIMKKLLLVSVLMVFVSACSNNNDWYDQSKTESQARERFKQDLRDAGYSDKQASDAWRDHKSRMETEGYKAYDDSRD